VPARIFELVDEFYECAGCDKVFWVGPKSESAVALMESLYSPEGRAIATPLRPYGGGGNGGGGGGDRSGRLEEEAGDE
jgi:hypothetical protein